MQVFSWGLTFVVIYGSMALSLVLLAAAGILYSRVKSVSTAAFFVGMLAAAIAPWIFRFATDGTYSRGTDNIQTLVNFAALAVQSFGLLFYALSLPKKANERSGR